MSSEMYRIYQLVDERLPEAKSNKLLALEKKSLIQCTESLEQLNAKKNIDS